MSYNCKCGHIYENHTEEEMTHFDEDLQTIVSTFNLRCVVVTCNCSHFNPEED